MNYNTTMSCGLVSGFLLLLGCAPQAEETHEAFNEWVSLGKEQLESWNRTEGLKVTWQLDTLHLESGTAEGETWLVSPKSYEDFLWEMEIKGSAVPSALAFRWDAEKHEAPNYQVSLHNDPHQQNPTGTIFKLARATYVEELNSEDWFHLGIETRGTHLKVYVNDQLVAECNDGASGEGMLAIKPPENGSPLRIRNLRTKRLPPDPSNDDLLEKRYRADSTREWQELFRDGSLGGWTVQGDGAWEIEDGVLHGYSGKEGGFLVSDEAYKNFYLTTKFKIEKEDNSGIFIRKHPDSTAVTLTDAIECNIYDHNGPSHPYSTGSIATHARAWFGMIDYQDWNTMEIFAENDHVVLYVNQKKAAESYLEAPFNKRGQIAFQGGIRIFSDGDPSNIYFKEFRIKNMD